MKDIYKGDMADDFNSDCCNSLKKHILEKAIVMTIALYRYQA